MGSIVNFADAVRTVIEAGTTVEGNVVKIIADNGAEIGNGVKYTVLGGNGVASTVTAMTQTAGTTTTTTGLAFLSVDLGIAGAAIAPALGVLAGVGLYNLAPEFWTNVSNALVEAGKTVGGAVVGYWNGSNLYFDDATIEIFKNFLIESELYTNIAEMENMTIDGVTYTPIPVQMAPWYYVIDLDSQTQYPNTGGVNVIASGSDVYMWAKMTTETVYRTIFCSRMPFTVDVWSDIGGSESHSTYNANRYTFNDMEFYMYVSGGSTTWLHTGIGEIYNMPLNGREAVVSYIVLFSDTPINYNSLQNGAKFPKEGEQFPLTYPEWYPFNYPEIDPTGLPTVYPLKYPEVEPNPYPKQDEAQDPAEEQDTEVYPYIIPSLPIPDPWVNPDPDPDIDDPDPIPDDPDPIPDDPDPIPDDDPVDPNDDDDPTPIIVDPDPPATVTSSKLFTVYNPSSANLNSLGAYLWDSSLMASLRDIWQDPLDGVISLIQVFATPSTSGSQNIILGYLDSGVSAPVVSSQFVTIDCGSVTVPENKENATDYAPYTSLHLFLPFIGMVELDANECMKSTIKIVYKVDVYTGTCLAQVKVTRTKDMPNGPILYVFSGNCSQQIPLTSGNATGVLTALIGGITAGLSVASGGGLGVVAGTQIAGNSLTHDMFHVSHSGNISANAGIMGNKKPYLIIERRHGYDANNYSSFYGFPANKTVNLGNHTGYVKVKKCFLKTTATQPEHDEIMRLLQEGVIL